MKTLRDYIAYQRENGYMQEAAYFETEVVAILKQFGCENPLGMDAELVGPKLNEIHGALSAELERIQTMPTQKWDVELNGFID